MLEQTDGLTCEVSREGDQAIVQLAGELDMATAPALRRCLDTLAEASVATVVVDLSRLEFCDSSGLAAFVGFHRAADGDSRLVLRSPSLAIERLLAVTQLQHLLEVDGRPA